MFVDGDILRLAPCVIVEQDAATHDALLGPLADAVDVRGAGPVDVGQRDVVVEALGLLVGKVAQTVPLRGGLGIEGPDVVVDDTGRFVDYLFVEFVAVEEGEVALGIEGPVEADAGWG